MDSPTIEYDMPASEYHSDPCPLPSVSHSCAVELIRNGAFYALREHPRFGGVRRDQTSKMSDGQIAHALMLGEESSFRVVDAESYRSKAAQAARSSAVADGLTPVLERKFESMVAATISWREQLAELGVKDLNGLPCEVSCFWEEFGIWRRARFDAIDRDNLVIYDIKLTEGPLSKDSIERQFGNMGYAIQTAAYLEGAERCHHDTAGRWRFEFLAATLDPPLITRVIPDDSFLELGRLQWTRAWTEFGRAIKNPPRTVPPITISARGYLLAKEQEFEVGTSEL